MGCVESLSLLLCVYVKSLPLDDDENDSKKVLIKELDETEKTNGEMENNEFSSKNNGVDSGKEILEALLRFLNPFQLLNPISEAKKTKLVTITPTELKTFLDSIGFYQPQSSILLSITMANVLTTVIRHLAKELEQTTTKNFRMEGPTGKSTSSTQEENGSEPDRFATQKSQIHQTLYKFSHLVLIPILNTIQDCLKFNEKEKTPKNEHNNNLVDTLASEKRNGPEWNLGPTKFKICSRESCLSG